MLGGQNVLKLHTGRCVRSGWVPHSVPGQTQVTAGWRQRAASRLPRSALTNAFLVLPNFIFFFFLIFFSWSWDGLEPWESLGNTAHHSEWWTQRQRDHHWALESQAKAQHKWRFSWVLPGMFTWVCLPAFPSMGPTAVQAQLSWFHVPAVSGSLWSLNFESFIYLKDELLQCLFYEQFNKLPGIVRTRPLLRRWRGCVF